MPVRALHFSSPVKVRGYPGAGNTLVADKSGANMWSSSVAVESILLYRGEFLVDGFLFIPKTAGCILGWEF